MGIIRSEELADFCEERKQGAIYTVKAKIKHPPTYSGIITAPVLPIDEFHQVIPFHLIWSNIYHIKVGEVGLVLNTRYEKSLQSISVNWRNSFQIYYPNPTEIPGEVLKIPGQTPIKFPKSVSLEDMFEFIIKKPKKD